METLPLKRGIIKNIDFLVSHGESDIRRDALDIVEAGILGADPGRGTLAKIWREGERLFADGKTYELNWIKNIYVLGAGKGSFPIAEALDSILGERIREGFVVVKKGEKRRLQHIEIFEAGHPIPDENSVMGVAGSLKSPQKLRQEIWFCCHHRWLFGSSRCTSSWDPAGRYQGVDRSSTIQRCYYP